MKNFKWEKGRQDSGYSKMLIATAKFPIPWDCYILKYPTGSSIDEHVDSVTNRAHYRLNIVIKKPKKGGEFFSEKSIINTSRIKLFRPDLYKHSLTKIEEGNRYILSIGWAPKNRVHLTSKRTPLLLLAITALASSKMLLASFHDPEGTNLLVVMGMAFIIYAVSGVVYLKSSVVGAKRFWLAMLIQVVVAVGLYFLLK